MEHHKLITNGNKRYVVFEVKYKDYTIPSILDYGDFKTINKMNKNWRCNQNGFISCSHTLNGVRKDVYMHELIMLLKINDGVIHKQNKSIRHINRVGLDNRRENLIYDSIDNDISKNIKKKKRTVDLPKESGIDPDNIPTYIWYMKPDGSHGERFNVNIGDVSWKSSSARDLTLKYKLEEAKMFVRHLMKTSPHLFEEYSMNGDYTKEGKDLLHSYYDIVHSAGHKNIKKFIPEHNTLDLLKPDHDKLNNEEKYLFFETRNWVKNNY
jgi:hypothetical protein